MFVHPFLLAPDEGGSAPAPADTANTEPTQEGGDTPTQAEIDWQKRYEDLRPEYTRASQEAARFRQIREDPDEQARFLAELGYEVETDHPDPEVYEDGADPKLSALEQRLAAIEQAGQEAEAVRQMQEVERIFDRSFTSIGQERGKPLTEKEREIVKSYALLNDLAPEDAYKTLTGLYESQLEDWASTKKTSHRVSPTGSEATQQPNMDDPTERQAWMAQRLAELDSGT